MADRGDVLELRQRVGFGTPEGGSRVVVVQATALNASLPTMVVVPLDVVADPYVDAELLVRVSATESGLVGGAVAIPTHLRVVSGNRLSAGRVGRLRPSTMAMVDEKIRLVLDL